MQQYPAYGAAYQQQHGAAGGQPAGAQQQAQQQQAQAQQQQALGLAGQRGAGRGAAGAAASQLSARYELLGKIGEGTYGLVYLAYSRDNPSKMFAIKTFKTARVRGRGGCAGRWGAGRCAGALCW